MRAGMAVIGIFLAAAAMLAWFGLNLFSDKFSVADDLNWVREAADLCEEAAVTISQYKIPEGDRITLASECLDTFNQFLVGLPHGTRVPIRVTSSFRRYLTALRTFEAEHKLTPHQSDVLGKAEALAAQIDPL